MVGFARFLFTRFWFSLLSSMLKKKGIRDILNEHQNFQTFIFTNQSLVLSGQFFMSNKLPQLVGVVTFG